MTFHVNICDIYVICMLYFYILPRQISDIKGYKIAETSVQFDIHIITLKHETIRNK